MGTARWQVLPSLRFSPSFKVLMIFRPVDLLSFCWLKAVEYLPGYGVPLRGGYQHSSHSTAKLVVVSCSILHFCFVPFSFSVSTLKPVRSEGWVVYKRGFLSLSQDTSKSCVCVLGDFWSSCIWKDSILNFDFLIFHRTLVKRHAYNLLPHL